MGRRSRSVNGRIGSVDRRNGSVHSSDVAETSGDGLWGLQRLLVNALLAKLFSVLPEKVGKQFVRNILRNIFKEIFSKIFQKFFS